MFFLESNKNTLTLPQTWCQPSESSRLHPEKRRGVRAVYPLSGCKHGHDMTLIHRNTTCPSSLFLPVLPEPFQGFSESHLHSLPFVLVVFLLLCYNYNLFIQFIHKKIENQVIFISSSNLPLFTRNSWLQARLPILLN